jgi:hypothetical protein
MRRMGTGGRRLAPVVKALFAPASGGRRREEGVYRGRRRRHGPVVEPMG